ncbi:MAG: hypothetical protein V7K48_27725 [Nostoc sp.]|uniref:hypothetical protein n=1 Tax=Nostoc sp. TaxID=1180 RepID=UPI002FF5844A
MKRPTAWRITPSSVVDAARQLALTVETHNPFGDTCSAVSTQHSYAMLYKPRLPTWIERV